MMSAVWVSSVFTGLASTLSMISSVVAKKAISVDDVNERTIASIRLVQTEENVKTLATDSSVRFLF